MGVPRPRQFERSQSELGYHLESAKEYLGVCPGCVADDGLRAFVASYAQIERCDFCGAEGPQGLHLGALFEYMARCLAAEWDLAINELYYGERDEVWESGGAPVYDGFDLLGELGDPLANPELCSVFVAAFDQHRVSRHAFRLAHHERLAYGWETFARFVKEESRYLFLRTGRGPQGDEQLIAPAQLLDEVGMALENGDLIRTLQPGSPLYRARQHLPGEVLATPQQLGSPPRERAAANRMSPAGIPMFYGSEDPATALAELRPEPALRSATVGTWTTARALRFLDLVNVDVPSLFDLVGKRQRPWRLFLKGFADDVSLPPKPGGEAVDYVPTQVFTEYVRHVLGGSGEPVRGIRYRSAMRPEGASWVLFFDHTACTEASSGWECNSARWLGLQASSLQHSEAVPGVPGWPAMP